MINEQLLKHLERAKQHLIIVEGKKDKAALEKLGFENIFVINKTGKSLPEQMEQIQELVGKDKVCILTDFDKKGKQLYLLLKSKLQEIGVRQENSLRGVLLEQKISHIEGLAHFVEKGGKDEQFWKKHKKYP